MRTPLRVGLVALVVAGGVGGAIWAVSGPGAVSPGSHSPLVRPLSTGRSDPKVPLFSDNFVDDSGYDLAFRHSLPVTDRADLAKCLASAEGRGARALADVKAALQRLALVAPRPPDYDYRRAMLQMLAGLTFMYDGRFDVASAWFEKALIDNADVPRETRANLLALRGVAALRKGEVDNCVACTGPSTCIFPIASDAVHLKVDGSRAAAGYFTEYLDARPDDLGVRWLLNIAHMTLGEYPAKVPPAYLIELGSLRSKPGVGRFENVATAAGIDARGPNMLGGAVFDDFDGDGRPDVLVASGDWDLGGSLFVNKGDGAFEDRGRAAGLDGLKMVVNLSHADYDNDGRLDVLALRGGWETPYPLTLLRNVGGKFEDVTAAAGLVGPIASQTAAWGDFDRDGKLDLYVGGEYHDRNATAANLGRLYRNRGDGTFENVASTAGVENERWAKGVAWGDYDDDGDPDLYVSNMNGPNRLYRNNGDGTFTDVAPELGLTEPLRSFSCWFWDYDDDGRLDLFVAGFGASLQDMIADAVGRPAKGERPRLYRNLGPDGFKDVTADVGLDRVWMPMGSNVADVDNDGYLDIYLATGRPPYSVLVPNVMLKNVGGTRFDDVTTASGTGHLQKGHGVAFADMDDDGDLDLFVETGGQTPGDKAHNVLFRNPGSPGRRAVRFRLVGTTSNRSAIGAKVRAEVVGSGGERRTLHRVVGGGSSFGGNSLAVSIGLGEKDVMESLTVIWPSTGPPETFRINAKDRAVEIVEGSGSALRAGR